MNHQALRQRVTAMQAKPPEGVENSTQPTLASNTRESIFLFVPNLIGMLVRLLR